ncbi:MAG: hypothetical protein HFI46_12050 [Lachnospiraceae bacterium]|nr:hypothetical protein [Lachnospiraceae bacterium]
MANNDLYINYMSRTYAGVLNSLASGSGIGERKDFGSLVAEKESSERAEAAEKVEAAFRDNMSLDEYKQYIYEKISRIPMHPSQMMRSVCVHISDAGFEAMKKDPEYERWVLDVLRKDFSYQDPWADVAGESFAVHRFGATRQEYRGDSWYLGFRGGRGGILYDEEAEESFWEKRCKRFKKYMKQCQEAAKEKQIQKRVIQEAAIRRGDFDEAVFAEGLVQTLNLGNFLFASGEGAE